MDALSTQTITFVKRDLFTIYEGIVPNSCDGKVLHARVQVVAALIRRNERNINVIEADHEREMHQFWATKRAQAAQINDDEPPLFFDGDFVIIDSEAVRSAIQNPNSSVEDSKANSAV